MRGAPRSHFGLCGPDCSYRSLYEGSQSSLSDMGAKQAVALIRVARLRAGVVAALKQTFPVEFPNAEKALGHRMSAADDEVLLAYLNGFLAMPRSETAATHGMSAAASVARSGADLSTLRQALAECGVTLPASENVHDWADAVRRWGGAQGTHPQVAVTAPSAAGQGPTVHISDNRVTHDLSEAVSEPEGDYVTDLSSAQGWEDMFGTDLPAEPAAAPEELAPSGDAFDGLFDEDLLPPLDDAPVAAPTSAVDDLAGLFDDDSLPDQVSPSRAEPASPTAPAPTATGASSSPQSVETGEKAADPAVLTVGSLAEVLRLQQRGAAGETSTTDAPAVAAAPTPEPSTQVNPPALPDPDADGEPTRNKTSRTAQQVKPELFPQPSRAAKKVATRPPRRAPRVAAAAPESGVADAGVAQAAAEADGTLTDALRQQLTAAVCLPRPVFTSDLAAMVDQPSLVEQWEQECRAMGTAGPLRFIMAKPRHRERGNLVIPFDKDLRKAATEFDKSMWSRCLNESTLKGAKLYEVAVLLHRFGDQLVTAEINANTVTLRINQQRGLVGVVMVLDTDLDPGEETREELATEVETLMASRMTLMAVLTYNGGSKTLADLGNTLRDEANARSWSVTCPVIVGHSWDFASDGGTSAVSVLG